jgi:CRP-like cAMP-binding protein
MQAEERLIVHGARDDFMAILRERKQVEMEAAMPQPIIQPKQHQGVQDIQLLTSLLKVPSEQRINADLVLIANQIRYTGIFERLYISLDLEGALCRILQFRKFHTKGATVVHEGQCRGSFYMVLEGTLVVLASRREALEQPKGGLDEKLADQKYVLVANIIEALSVAASDKSGTSDPFVTVKLGMQEKSTSIKKETLNPIWDETLRISNVEPDDETVEISVWDHDTWGDTDFLGIVTVPMASLRENLHHVQDFALKLGEDARYQASADEAGVYYEISGSICFHLQLTTEAVLSQIEQLELGDDRAGRSKVYYTAGDTFGAEQVFSSIGMAPNSIIIEQPTTVLRVGAASG